MESFIQMKSDSMVQETLENITGPSIHAWYERQEAFYTRMVQVTHEYLTKMRRNVYAKCLTAVHASRHQLQPVSYK
jgi:hypothetical protein